jgi:hypothetical protein
VIDSKPTSRRRATAYSIANLLAFAFAVRAAAGSADTWLEFLRDAERYDESVWHEAVHSNAPPDSGYFGDGASGGNGGIRGSCGVAVAYAVLVRALPADPKRANRLAHIRQALNYAAHTHLSGTKSCVDGKQWGHSWQSALWAGSMGLACALVERDLPAATVATCRRAVADEATFRAGIPPGSGFHGDTKAEENGWDSNVLALAAAWESGHTNAGLWLTAAKKYLVNTSTVANTNGDPLASWITTVTLYPSFAVENHGFYHPSYETDSGNTVGDSLLMARVANPAIAAQLQPFAEHNVLNVWRHLSHMLLDSGEFAFPSGMDWALHNYEQVSYHTWLATHFNDSLARWADRQITQLLRHRQIINGDGRILGDTEANAFYMEAVVECCTAIAWLHHADADFTDSPVVPPAAFVEHYPDIKLIAQRGPWGFVSLSYGPRIMGFIEPATLSVPTNVYVTTPRLPGLIGLGALGNPTAAHLVRFATNATGFEAELKLQNGGKGSTEVYVKSTGETVAIVEVPRATISVMNPNAGSFSVGIENHALTGGSRLLSWQNGGSNIVARSGVTVEVTNPWVCVSERLGMIAGPAGRFRYQAARNYNRRGAAEDMLEFDPQIPLSPRYAVFLPGGSSRSAAAVAAHVRWQVAGTNGVLTFSDSRGDSHELTAVVQP